MYRFPLGCNDLISTKGGEFVEEHPSCLRLLQGTSWQKAFWINLLIHCPAKKGLGVRLVGSAAAHFN